MRSSLEECVPARPGTGTLLVLKTCAHKARHEICPTVLCAGAVQQPGGSVGAPE